MALTDSMFLFEIKVEELKSFINCREFIIKSQFADVFNINLKDPNESGTYLRTRPHKVKRKTRSRTAKPSDKSPKSPSPEAQTGVSVLVENNADNLISNMNQYPMELSLWSKLVPDYKIGSTNISWSAPFIDYLKRLNKKQEPVCVQGDYNVFHEMNSKRMAVVKMVVKLSYIKYKPTVISNITNKPDPLTEGIIAVNSSKKRRGSPFNQNTKINIKKKKEVKSKEDSSSKERCSKFETNEDKRDNKIESQQNKSGVASVVRSYTKLRNIKHVDVIKTKSCSSIDKKMYDYIFGGSPSGPFGNQIYCVSYFTVAKDFVDSPKSEETEKPTSEKTASEKSKSPSEKTKSPSDRSQAMSEKSKSDGEQEEENYKFRVCKGDCPRKVAGNVSGTRSYCSLDLPLKATELITVKKCGHIDCENKIMRKLPTPPDNRTLLELSTRGRDCCDVREKVEEVIGGMTAKMKFGSEPCYCECECQFGFIKKTTFCDICGGYEVFGDEYAKTPGFDLPFPCPIYHKLADKNRLMKLSTSGSDTKRDKKEIGEPKKKEVPEPKKEKKEAVELKGDKKGASESKKDKKDPADSKKEKKGPEKVIESEKEVTKKGKHKKKDDKFKFNYGYSGIPPHIGHSHCALPCTGTLTVVPKTMGWLWNAENVPGIKFRPQWKPGATNKHIVRLLKIAKNPGEVIAKRFRKKDLGKVKRPLKRPLLIVHKKEGEYTVTMETMKTYTKPRTFNQYPYEDKPLVTYTIGRTAEENLERKKKKERAQRRLERLQRDFVQSAFKDMCHEICLKTYQQALGILPNAEKPDCPCYKPEEDHEDSQSCSCSEDKQLTESDTDSDEWIVEFTPPTATFDPTFKCKKVLTADSSSQYTYLDYRVKLLDRYGNPVPRYFKGPDGKQECSDLGGFWGPDGKWLEINTDGHIGPDEKWAPNIFIGPDGEHVDAETGKFQSSDGKWLVVGVDGYVEQGKWKFYPKTKPPQEPKKKGSGKKPDKKEDKQQGLKNVEATWSCFGSASPKQLSKMGIVGHGQDKKLLLSTLQTMMARGEDVKIPEPKTIPRSGKTKGKYGSTRARTFVERKKCKHATPSDKGIIAVDGRGNKIYFRLKDYRNRRPKDRVNTLTEQGISVSSFHMPCFHSFISSEIMKKEQYDRLVALAKAAGKGKNKGSNEVERKGGGAQRCTTASTQADFVYVV
ncbi:uncharacterized protein LOC110369700 [Helicoverpa armigera]|uniref:uncharacterized protein LOC110369700 n=1 Tax=Helicoverpa armigera TaxID=29058 RepID=UPI0030835972